MVDEGALRFAGGGILPVGWAGHQRLDCYQKTSKNQPVWAGGAIYWMDYQQVPMLRLTGKWLAKAGFDTRSLPWLRPLGTTVTVRVIRSPAYRARVHLLVPGNLTRMPAGW
jgi:hypothetical protein